MIEKSMAVGNGVRQNQHTPEAFAPRSNASKSDSMEDSFEREYVVGDIIPQTEHVDRQTLREEMKNISRLEK